MEQYAGLIARADLLYLLDVTDVDLNDPRRLRKVEDVLKHFKADDKAKSQVLKILNKDRREDKLDAIWTWVQLEQERQQKIASLNPEDFTDDIQEELKSGFLSKEKIKELQKQLKQMEQQERAAELRAESAKAQGRKEARKEDRALDKALAPSRTATMQKKIDELDAVTQELSAYQ